MTEETTQETAPTSEVKTKPVEPKADNTPELEAEISSLQVRLDNMTADTQRLRKELALSETRVSERDLTARDYETRVKDLESNLGRTTQEKALIGLGVVDTEHQEWLAWKYSNLPASEAGEEHPAFDAWVGTYLETRPEFKTATIATPNVEIQKPIYSNKGATNPSPSDPLSAEAISNMTPSEYEAARPSLLKL
jgi:septal ring factor EnvC (AmiA/AmiB activator)